MTCKSWFNKRENMFTDVCWNDVDDWLKVIRAGTFVAIFPNLGREFFCQVTIDGQ
jgi:hypothetical protein